LHVKYFIQVLSGLAFNLWKLIEEINEGVCVYVPG